MYQLLSSTVFILCAYGDEVIRLMAAANDAGLMTGEYVFIAIDYGNMADTDDSSKHVKQETLNGEVVTFFERIIFFFWSRLKSYTRFSIV